jgi:hypothetical protein
MMIKLWHTYQGTRLRANAFTEISIGHRTMHAFFDTPSHFMNHEAALRSIVVATVPVGLKQNDTEY